MRTMRAAGVPGMLAVCSRALLACVLLGVPLLAGFAEAREPGVTTSYFANLPAKVSYFDDSSVVLWHDADTRTVFRSENEGRTWAPVRGPPKGSAFLLIEHPYDPKQAFILSDALEHWRTTDRGRAWQRFRTPDPPAVRAGRPLDFHADDKHREYILYTGRRCSPWTPWHGSVCHDVVYYTTDAFASDVKQAMDVVLHCNWAKTTREIVVPEQAIQRIFCIAWDQSANEPSLGGNQGQSKTRLYASDDFFQTKREVDLGLGRDARGFMGLGASRRYLITALQAPGGARELSLFVTLDGVQWAKARFPHGQLLHENAYTILDGPRFHLLVDVLDASTNQGALFLSDGSGTNFTMGLHGTQRSPSGIVDYEHLANIDGVAIANVRTAATHAHVQTRITHDEGSHWTHLRAPAKDVDGRSIGCNVADAERCSLHLHALVHPHNVGRTFSSSAPGLVMGVGSVGASLRPYADCDTFLSTDAGATWTMVARHPHKYEFGDQGGLLVMVPDVGPTDVMRFSFDYGASWHTLRLGARVLPFVLTTIPDSTALKFLLIGSRMRGEADDRKRHAAVFVDFAPLKKRKCGARDFEKWYATGPNGPCIMGHRQWFMRRRPSADCVVLEKFHDPTDRQDACMCTAADYECDTNFVLHNGRCEPTVALPIPHGACQRKTDTFRAPSGYRKVPGNTCQVQAGHRALDAPIERPCAQAGPPVPGAIQRQTFAFPAPIADVLHFARSPHVVVRLVDGQVFQSADDGNTWHELKLLVMRFAQERAMALVSHAHDRQRAYILTHTQVVFYTTDGGVHWRWFTAPLPPNRLLLAPLDFHPTQPDWLLWTGSRDCDGRSHNCHTEVSYSLDHGVHWKKVDTYVRKCAWLQDTHFRAADARAILCESYKEKRGEQPARHTGERTLQLVLGHDLYRKRRVVFEHVLGFSVFEQYLLVAEVVGTPPALRMHVSVDAGHFAEIRLPPKLELEKHSYTVLDSVTRAVFLHVTTQALWGDLVKSNSNGTYYTLSLENVNRDPFGFVDFEKMHGMDGVALANVVSNPEEAALRGPKRLRTRITHNDGGRWEMLTPPAVDVHGNAYACNEVGCNLHLHGVLERPDVGMMTSTPAATGFMLGVGNVGRTLAPYRECDTFLTRDGGFTWEEVHKDAHKWAFGDHGALVLLVDDENPTDEVLYTLDQGISWKSFKFGERMRVLSIDAVPEETKRKFVLFGHTASAQPRALAVSLDFTAVLPRMCVFDKDTEKSDFEHWSPSEQREETCLFGARRWYWRRKRDRACFVGDRVPAQPVQLEHCACSDADMECEFNYFRDPNRQQCVAYNGAAPLPADRDAQCTRDAPEYDGYWYERTNVRKIPMSLCRGGTRPDRGARHRCPHTPRRHGVFWWVFVMLLACAGGIGVMYWWTGGTLHAYRPLQLEEHAAYRDVREQIGLVWHFALGLASLAWSRAQELAERLPFARDVLRRRSERPFSSYHMLSTDEDAEILRGYDSDELPP